MLLAVGWQRQKCKTGEDVDLPKYKHTGQERKAGKSYTARIILAFQTLLSMHLQQHAHVARTNIGNGEVRFRLKILDRFRCLHEGSAAGSCMVLILLKLYVLQHPHAPMQLSLFRGAQHRAHKPTRMITAPNPVGRPPWRTAPRSTPFEHGEKSETNQT